MSTLVDDFTSHQRRRGFSEQTIKRRTASLRSLCRTLGTRHLFDATLDDIEAWLGTFASPRTRHAYRSDAVVFYRWAMRHGLTGANPAELTDSIRVPKPLPRPLAVDIAKVIAAAPNDDTRLMLALGFYAGLRVFEIAALRVEDVHLLHAPAVLVVRSGKGAKDRTVALHPDLAAMLAAMLADRGPGRLFRLTAETVANRIAKHLRSCNIDAVAHQLRHTFGTELARATNGNMLIVAQMMGHADMSTTMGYVRLADQTAAQAVAGMYSAA